MTTQTQPIDAAGVRIGGKNFVVIAGPCAIESEKQLIETAEFVKSQGASVLRGGIFKLRTHPDSFQGCGEKAYHYIDQAKKRCRLPIISEITDPRQIDELINVIDIFQVGSRNMYNYSLLKELGKVNKAVLIKRGFSATIEEWTLAAKYVVQAGNQKVFLCERGIRTFEKTMRNTLDLATVSYIKQNTTIPIIVDPSHATGIRELIKPMSLASAAAGADGLIIEVHPHPEQAKSDGFQALNFEDFADLMEELKPLLNVLGRPLARSLFKSEASDDTRSVDHNGHELSL